MRRARYLTAAAIAWALLGGSIGAAEAAVPSNDTFAGATAIAALPFSQTLDTTEATTDSIDAEASANCESRVTEASVWYAFTPSTNQYLHVEVFRSSYRAGVLVVTGAPGSFTLRTCGDWGGVILNAQAGQTYYILAFDVVPGEGNGGTLELSVAEAPPPPEVHLTLDPTGTFNPRTGAAIVGGTLTCSGVVRAMYLDAYLSQQAGRFEIRGYGYAYVNLAACDGTRQQWWLTVNGANGKFAGGHATLSVFFAACGPFFCSDEQVTGTIRLRGRG